MYVQARIAEKERAWRLVRCQKGAPAQT